MDHSCVEYPYASIILLFHCYTPVIPICYYRTIIPLLYPIPALYHYSTVTPLCHDYTPMPTLYHYSTVLPICYCYTFIPLFYSFTYASVHSMPAIPHIVPRIPQLPQLYSYAMIILLCSRSQTYLITRNVP